MSYTDPCSNCGQSRVDCDCGDWNAYKRIRLEKMLGRKLSYPVETMLYEVYENNPDYDAIKDENGNLKYILKPN